MNAIEGKHHAKGSILGGRKKAAAGEVVQMRKGTESFDGGAGTWRGPDHHRGKKKSDGVQGQGSEAQWDPKKYPLGKENFEKDAVSGE